MSLRPPPWNILVRNQEAILIVSAVKSLQTMSADCFSIWGLRPPDFLPGLRPWAQLGDFRPLPLGYYVYTLLGYNSLNEDSWRRDSVLPRAEHKNDVALRCAYISIARILTISSQIVEAKRKQ